MTYIQAIILGLVQGLAEFLPVSSSGHLAILQTMFGVEESSVLLFTVLLHAGTLASVFIIYWEDIRDLILELFATIGDIFTGKGLRLENNPLRKLGCLIIVACIPTAIIGILFEDFFEAMYSNLLWVATGLIITGILLWIGDKSEEKRNVEEMNFRNALFIGVVQGIAIWPGISRSGSTLFGSLFCKLERKFAVEFVFLISIPAILGSLILELPDAFSQTLYLHDVGPIVVGMLVAFFSGILAIKFMIKVVSNSKLKYFSIYVWAVALAVIIYSVIKFI